MFFYQEFIAEAFYRKDVASIEAVFRTLVGGPSDSEIETPNSALLIECCRKLADDGGIMPFETIDDINRAVGPHHEDPLVAASPYSAGAARVWSRIDHFAPLFGEAPHG